MVAFAAALAIAAPLVFAADKSEQNFLHLPSGYDFRFQKLHKSDRETGWPFTIERGVIACAWGMGQRLTYFYEDMDDVEAEDEGGESGTPRILVLTANPFDLIFLNIANQDLFVQSGTIEERIKLVAPFVDIAQKLCDQPPGVKIGPTEL